jgi:Calcineurin-like phosphoesterase
VKAEHKQDATTNPQEEKATAWGPLRQDFWRDRWEEFIAFLSGVKNKYWPRSPGEPMVDWYNPQQLFQTALETFVSKTLGRHADRRSIEAANKVAKFFDFSFEVPAAPATKGAIDPEKYRPEDLSPEPLKEIWIDYVSDLGDGFNSTYAVAYLLAQEQLQVEGVTEPLQRGNILIFGGDEVYPTADRKEYKNRLVTPYRYAMRNQPQPAPFLFALPGNHDWYDSLSSFLEFFGDYEQHSFADKRWQVPQNRSYFALKLPHNWWLLGVDFQLQSDLDYWQIKYFEKIVQQMKRGDRIILCCAEPFWVYEKMYPAFKAKNQDSNLHRLLEMLRVPKERTDDVEENDPTPDKQIVLYLAGDLHHYFRVWTSDGRECTPKKSAPPPEKTTLQITSGGGGAFLHPTHGAVQRAYKKEDVNSYPPHAYSKRYGWWNLAFPVLNPRFGWVTSWLYVLLGGLFLLSYEEEMRGRTVVKAADWMEFLQSHIFFPTLETVFHSPLLLLAVIATCAGFFGFTLTEPVAYTFRWIVGWLHGLLHVGASFLLTGWLYYRVLPAPSSTLIAVLFMAPLLFVAGWIVGSFLMGLYLTFALNICGQHMTAAFSSLRIQDWKNFLRLKLDLTTGQLTIYPIGIDRVPRNQDWTTDPAGQSMSYVLPTAPHYRPSQELHGRLIEGPIVLTPMPGQKGKVEIDFDPETKHTETA